MKMLDPQIDECEVFKNSEFGEVRVVMRDGEPWFVGADLAKMLGYTNLQKAIRDHVDEDDKGVNEMVTPGGKQHVITVNESGLYALILSSKLPSAKKFKHWVTSEVLPSIRKTGGYEMPKTFSEALLAYAKEVEAREKLAAENAVMKPKADFYDAVASSESYLSMNDTAKILDMGVGRNKLFKILREHKVLMDDNLPYQEYVDRGYFKVKESHYMLEGNPIIRKTTLVKQKGLEYIRKLVKAEQ